MKKTLVIFVGLIILIISIMGLFFYFKSSEKIEEANLSTSNSHMDSNNNSNTTNSSWKEINLGKEKFYVESEKIELDLDGDNKKESIDLKNKGRFITINDVDYVVNKYCLKDDDSQNEENNTLQSKIVFDFSNEYNVNQFYFVDLNEDGIIEIIHRTFSDMISPITSKYTIYNFKNNELKEIGKSEIIGNLPKVVYVKNNKIKFYYQPYETEDGYEEKEIIELDI